MPSEFKARFNGLQINSNLGLKDCNGNVVKLQKKELAALVLLLRRAGKLVTRDELSREVWGQVSASDASIARCISRIKSALKEASSGCQSFIQTINGKGYCFTGHIQTSTNFLNEESFRTLINSSPDFIAFKDGEGRWLVLNEASINLYGLKKIAWQGKTDLQLAKILPAEYRESLDACIASDEAAWRSRSGCKSFEIVELDDGTKRYFDVVKTPIFHEDGKRNLLAIFGRDVTSEHGRQSGADLVRGNNQIGKINILIVEDDALQAEALALQLIALGYQIAAVAGSGEDAVRLAQGLSPDIVLMDVVLSGAVDGIAAAKIIHLSCDIPVLYLTAHADDAFFQRAKITDPYAYLVKPALPRDIQFAIEIALYRHRAERIAREVLVSINEERLELALEASGMDIWENDLITGDVTLKAIKIFSALGYNESETAVFADDIFAIVHPDDIRMVKDAISNHLTGGAPEYRCEFRARDKNGAWVWLASYGKVMRREGVNKGGRFTGVTFSIDDRKRKEEEIEMINHRLSEQNALIIKSEQSLRETHAIAGLGRYLFDFNSGFWVSSDILDAIFGIDETYARTLKGWTDLIHSDDRQMMVDYLEIEVLRQNGDFDKQYRIVRQTDQAVRWLHGLGKLEYDSQGHPVKILGTIQDVTELKHAEEKLRVAAIAFESNDGIMVTDRHTRIVRVNRSFTRLTGYTAEEAIGNTPAMLHSGRQDAGFYEDMWEAIHRDNHWVGEIWNRRKDGEVFPVKITITAVKDDSDSVTNYVAVFSDITRRKRAEDEISFLAYHDQLTALPNRQLFYDRLSQAMSHARRNQKKFALFFLDLDGFKPVNDTHGHETGDGVLKLTASRLQDCVRDVDTIARLGGDEFAIILGDIATVADSDRVAEKIIRTLAEPMEMGASIKCSIGVSIGISIYPEDGAEIDSLVKAADRAMYQSKRAGKGISTYAGKSPSEVNSRWVLLDDVHLLGIQEIDDQHQEMTDKLEELNVALNQGARKKKIAALFNEFCAAVQTHFDAEESMMSKYDFSKYKSHRKAHSELLTKIYSQKDLLSNGRESIVLQSLKEWVLEHILQMDREFSNFLMQQGIAEV